MGARIAIESNSGHQSATNSIGCSTQCETGVSEHLLLSAYKPRGSVRAMQGA